MESYSFKFKREDGCFVLPNFEFDPDLIIHFGRGNLFNSGLFYRELRSRFNRAIIIGCGSGGHFHQAEIIDDDAAGIMFKFEKTKLRLESLPIKNSGQSFEVGCELGRKLASADLAGVFVLAEGLDINGDELMEGLSSALPRRAVVGGGMASDGTDFNATLVSANCEPRQHLVAAVGFYGDKIELNNCFETGWKRTGLQMKITSSSQNHAYEFDHQPAFEMYRERVGCEAAALHRDGLRFPILVSDPGNSRWPVIRTILASDQGSGRVTFAGDLPQGGTAEIMHAEISELIAAAKDVAIAAVSKRSSETMAAIIVSCIGRRTVLGDRAADEISEIQKHLPENLSYAGFYSNGEFSKCSNDPTARLLNQTVTCFTISEMN